MSIPELHWKSHYDCGIPEIDLQHRYFLQLINRVSIELNTSSDANYRARLLQEVAKYAQFHFISEENLMLKFGYPEFDQHRQLHIALMNELSWRSQKSVDDLLEFLVGWFINHTVEKDHDFGNFIRCQSSPHDGVPADTPRTMPSR